jgi:Flp pilus assembly secretin CpaC
LKKRDFVLRSILTIGCLTLIFLLAFGCSLTFSADKEIRVVKGKSVVLEYPEKVQTISLANSDVADVVSITPTELVIIGKEVGITTLAVWGESKKHISYDIKVDRNFAGQQVVLEVKVAEVNKNAASELGFDFLFINTNDRNIAEGEKTLGVFGGLVQTPNIPLTIGEGVTGKIGYVGKGRDYSTIIHALEEKGDLKLLAEPKLLSLSGEKASFLVGGEIPIPVAQTVSGGGASTVTIEWKEYGVKLNFIPTVVDSNLINLKITPEVSSLDYTNAISLGGYSIPAIHTRKAETSLELNSGQSIVLGGLISEEMIKSIKRVPVLGSIPILGTFFSRRETSKNKNELMIIVSPRIIASVAEEEIPPLPWEGSKK